MARKSIGINLDDSDMNSLEHNFIELYNDLGTATKTKVLLDNFLNGSKVINRTMIGDAAVGASQIDNNSINSSKVRDDAIGIRHILKGSVTNEKLAEGSVDPTKLSVDQVTMNKGKFYPLVNYAVDGVTTVFGQATLDAILEAKVTGADMNKVYRLSSIRNGYNNTYGMNIDEFDLDENRNIDTTTRRRVISHARQVYPTHFTYNYGKTVGTVTAHRAEGLTVTVTFDVEALGQITNLAENELGHSQGAIIDPANYNYQINVNDAEVVSYNDHVIVDKTDTDMIIYIKSRDDIYTGYHLYRLTTPWQQGNQRSNRDLWSIGRVSAYNRQGDIFTEDSEKVFVYSNIAEPTYTNDTIFKLAGASDYSGGFYHGDEKIQVHYISIGNKDITDFTGRFSGKSLELMQHTHLYRDTSTSTTGDTTAFMSVKKTHRFEKETGYTLKTKLQALENFIPNFSSIGGWQMQRTFENGATNNITDAFDLTNIKRVNLRSADSVDKHFTGQGTEEYKVIGYFKDIIITYESDSEFFDTWLRNWAEKEMKIYSQVFENDVEVKAGTIVNASVNYKINTY